MLALPVMFVQAEALEFGLRYTREDACFDDDFARVVGGFAFDRTEGFLESALRFPSSS
jgi:hypothetical protein